MTIQWFPGHMTKARRLLEENTRLVDLVLELRDARVPLSSANPLLLEIMGKQQRLIVLTKADLADQRSTEAFVAHFSQAKQPALALDTRDKRAVRSLLAKIKELVELKVPRDRQSSKALRPGRILIAGIPNVGKSSLINALSNRAAAKTGALPGLTRAKQWIKLRDGVELLDTPGLLWPRIDDQTVAFRLAVTGAIGEGGFDNYELASSLMDFLATKYPALLRDHFNLEFEPEQKGHELLEALGRRRGCLLGRGEVDVERAANILLAEFRQGKVGRITLDTESEDDDV